MGWQPINTAPRDGSRVLCCWAGSEDSYTLLRWKTNDRIERHQERIRRGESFPDSAEALAEYMSWNASYFGDPWEWDDYDLAKPGASPTHWLPIPSTAVIQD